MKNEEHTNDHEKKGHGHEGKPVKVEADEFGGCPPGYIPDGKGGCVLDPVPPAESK